MCIYVCVCIHITYLNLNLHMFIPGTNEISYEELKALVEKSSNLFLVDVRNKDELDKGRIPGSVHIPGEIPYDFRINSLG